MSARAARAPTRDGFHFIDSRRIGAFKVGSKQQRSSRRTRDYWLLLLLLNGFFAAATFGPFQNPLTLLYGIRGMIVTTLGLTWVMWFVMDDY
jgi:hypothetical protein